MNRDDLVKILEDQQIAVLSTVDSTNKPHASTMFFTHDEKLNFFLITKISTKKYQNIINNNQAALTVIFLDEQKTVQAEGIVEIVPKFTEEFKNILISMSEKNAKRGGISWPPPLSKLPESDIAILKFTPHILRFSDYSKPEQEVFHQIIPS